MARCVEQPKGRWALVGGRIVLPGEVVSGRAVVVEGPTILGVADAGSLGTEVERIDVGGRYIAPGLIDIHTHGARNAGFGQATAQAFATITEENLRHGVTALVATVSAGPIPRLVRCLEFTRDWMGQPHAGAQILGLHLESPYMSPLQKGAQDPSYLRTPDDGTPDELLAHHDVLRIVALAPELPGALDLVARLARLGIVPAAGHSAARDEDVRAAMAVGLRHITHIWSGQSSTVREGPWRRPGLLEASLVFEGLSVEMISDNRHLPATLMKLAYKCIGPDRLCAVSDATSGAGLSEGARFRMGDMEHEVHDGVGMMLDRTAFAGSTTLLGRMVPILMGVVGIRTAEAIRMASLTPARVIGVDHRKGSLEAGKDADMAIFEADWTVWRCLIGGRWAHTAHSA